MVNVKGYFRTSRNYERRYNGVLDFVNGHVRKSPAKASGIEVTETPLSEFEHVNYGGTNNDSDTENPTC